MHQKKYIFIIIMQLVCFSIYCQNTKQKNIPFKLLFYKLPANSIGFITYNHGINTIMGFSGTYALVKSDFDWQWYQFARKNSSVSTAGWPSVMVGGLMPIAAPLSMYFYGKKHSLPKLQLTGLAVGQAALLSVVISSGIKTFTGRRPPDHGNETTVTDNYSSDFSFGFLNRGAFDGWPSGHTMTAFAMATTLTEMYPDNTTLKIGSYIYASLIGLGVSVNIHWFSDAFAGALMGYAIGKTVGKSFNSYLTDNKITKSRLYFYPSLNGAGLVYQFK